MAMGEGNGGAGSVRSSRKELERKRKLPLATQTTRSVWTPRGRGSNCQRPSERAKQSNADENPRQSQGGGTLQEEIEEGAEEFRGSKVKEGLREDHLGLQGRRPRRERTAKTPFRKKIRGSSAAEEACFQGGPGALGVDWQGRRLLGED